MPKERKKGTQSKNQNPNTNKYSGKPIRCLIENAYNLLIVVENKMSKWKKKKNPRIYE